MNVRINNIECEFSFRGRWLYVEKTGKWILSHDPDHGWRVEWRSKDSEEWKAWPVWQ